MTSLTEQPGLPFENAHLKCPVEQSFKLCHDLDHRTVTTLCTVACICSSPLLNSCICTPCMQSNNSTMSSLRYIVCSISVPGGCRMVDMPIWKQHVTSYRALLHTCLYSLSALRHLRLVPLGKEPWRKINTLLHQGLRFRLRLLQYTGMNHLI